MIASLRGTLLYSDDSSIVVECAGVGYKCAVTKNTIYNLPEIGTEIFLHTHLAVREDAMDLYGFSELEELDAFKLITSVSGVGPKIGIALLSQFTVSNMFLYIATEDAKSLTAASGVGLKLAQRIVLELKDKVGNLNFADVPSKKSAPKAAQTVTSASEAVEGLIALGYTKGEASLAVSRLDGNLSSGELIKEALKSLARR